MSRVVSGGIARWYLLLGAALMAVLLLTMSGGSFAQAAQTIVVINNGDSGPGSLRDAIDSSSAGDTITFGDVAGPILLSSELVIDKDLTIEGPGADILALDGQGSTRVLKIDSVTVEISGLTIQNGLSENSGGGIHNYDGTVTLTNSTVSGNRSSLGVGGGIYNNGTVTLTNSTVSGNEADNGGGGIYNSSSSGSIVTLTNTIIANNPNGGDCLASSPITSMGHNLDSDDSCELTSAGDLPNTDPLLGPLQDNGGPTLTHALLEGSPAIDAGDDSVLEDPLNLTTDQRGAGFPRLSQTPRVDDHVDIGAFELGASIVAVTCNGKYVTIPGTDGDDILTGTAGADVIAGLGGDDVILGLGGNDILCGGDGDDTIIGGGGNDRVWGEDGEDVLRGGRGKDRLYGGKHDDMLKGGRGKDRLYGQNGNDTLVGGKGNDQLYGNKGDDVLLGRAGNDNHYCGPGADMVNGGPGADDTQTDCERLLAIP